MKVIRDGEIVWRLDIDKRDKVVGFNTLRKTTDEFNLFVGTYFIDINIYMWDEIDNADEFFSELKENEFVFDVTSHYATAKLSFRIGDTTRSVKINFHQIAGGNDIYTQFVKWYEKE